MLGGEISARVAPTTVLRVNSRDYPPSSAFSSPRTVMQIVPYSSEVREKHSKPPGSFLLVHYLTLAIPPVRPITDPCYLTCSTISYVDFIVISKESIFSAVGNFLSERIDVVLFLSIRAHRCRVSRNIEYRFSLILRLFLRGVTSLRVILETDPDVPSIAF